MAALIKCYQSILIALVINLLLLLGCTSAYKGCKNIECKEEFNVINGLLDKLNSLEDCRLPLYEEVQIAYLSYQTVLRHYPDDHESRLSEDQKLLSTSLFDQWPSFYNHMSPNKGVLIKSASIRALICKIKPYQEAKFGVGNSICALQGVQQVSKKSKDNEFEKNAIVRYLKNLEGEELSDAYPEAIYPSKVDKTVEEACYAGQYDPLIDSVHIPANAIAQRIQEFRQRMDSDDSTQMLLNNNQRKNHYIQPSVRGSPDRTIMRDMDMDMPPEYLFSASSGRAEEELQNGGDSPGRVSDNRGQTERTSNGDDSYLDSLSQEEEKSDESQREVITDSRGIARLDRKCREQHLCPGHDKETDKDENPTDGSTEVEQKVDSNNESRTLDQPEKIETNSKQTPSDDLPETSMTTNSKTKTGFTRFKKRPPLHVPEGPSDKNGQGYDEKEVRRLQSFFGMAPSDLLIEDSYAKKRISQLALEVNPPGLVQDRKPKRKSLFQTLFRSKQRDLKKYLIAS